MTPISRNRACLYALCVIAILALAGCGGDDESRPVTRLPDFTGLVRDVAPAVVNISTTPPEPASRSGDGPNAAPNGGEGAPEDWLRRFFEEAPGDGHEGAPMPDGPGAMPHASRGSGFIISEDGYILTNRHVVSDAGQVIVKLADRRQLVAEIVGQDRYSDLALLKVEAEDLPTVEIGDPGELAVGSWVVAIGSPFGFETSVTAGIVSAKRRSLASDQYVPFLQTDVAINPGNSGGPLFNLAGKVVGINSQIYSQTGGYQGVSFAIPIDIAMNVVRQLREKGSVTRGWLGVQIQDVDRQLAESFGLERPEGALVARVMPESPAAQAGFRVGDVILSFDGRPVSDAAALPPLVGAMAPGTEASVTVLRDGEKRPLEVAIEALPKNLLARTDQGPSAAPERPYGLTLESLGAAQRERLGLEQGGVRITAVAEGPASAAGLQPGDIVLAVGSTPVEDVSALRNALDKAEGPVALLVLRDGNRLYLAMRPHAEESDSGPDAR